MERDLRVLQQMQAMPLKAKINTTKSRIMEWVSHFGLDGVYVSFSGGKDSTVLLHIAREMFPEIKAVFCDTGLEYPEIREFVKTFDNVDWLRPKMTFRQVIEKYGYPFPSKEVSESVQGARKYLTEVLEYQKSLQTDRQTDRQPHYRYYYDKLTGQGAYSKFSSTPYEMADNLALTEFSRGGYDNKWRKVRGIGEYSQRQNGKPQGREQSTFGSNVGDLRKGQDDKGEYP